MTTPSMVMDVKKAIEDVRSKFPGHQIDVTPDKDGGAIVVVHSIPLSSKYIQETTWVGFAITFQYPRADVYPHYIDPEVRRKDGAELGTGFGKATWQEKPCIQVSRRSNRWNSESDTAALKLAKVVAWINA